MTQMSGFEAFDRSIRDLGEVFYHWVTTQMAGQAWDRAVLDVRYAHDGSYWDDKMRVAVPGRPTVSLDTNDDIRRLLSAINKLRTIAFTEPWYGLKLEVQQGGDAKASYNYDPNCADDPTFFDD